MSVYVLHSDSERSSDGARTDHRGTAALPEAIFDALAQGRSQDVLGLSGGLTGRLWRVLYKHPDPCRPGEGGIRRNGDGGSLRTIQRATDRSDRSGRVDRGTQAGLHGGLSRCLADDAAHRDDRRRDRSPTSAVQAGTGDYGTWGIRFSLSGATKQVMVSYNPVQAVQHVQLGVKRAMTGQPGPVRVGPAQQRLDGGAGPNSVPRIYSTDAYFRVPWRGIDETALERSPGPSQRRPSVIIAGNSVRLSHAQESLARVARVAQFLCPRPGPARGSSPSGSSWRSVRSGSSGRRARRRRRSADVVLGVGTSSGRMTPSTSTGRSVDPARRCHPDRRRTNEHRVDLPSTTCCWLTRVHNDRLADIYRAQGREPSGNVAVRAEKDKTESSQSRHPGPTSDAPFAPQFLIEVIEEVGPGRHHRRL